MILEESEKIGETENSSAAIHRETRRVSFLIIAVFIVGLSLTIRIHYLLFHSLVELFSVTIAVTIFIIAWNSRRFMTNTYLDIIGLMYLVVAGLDLLHTLTYSGMGMLADSNHATQLWIAARYLESLSLTGALFLTGFRIRLEAIAVFYGTVFLLLLGSIFLLENFPVSYIEGSGLTPFKVVSEYVISAVLLIGIVLLIRRRTEYDKKVYRFLLLSLSATVFSELSFTLYTDPYGIMNELGHYLKLISFFFIYKAFVETGIRKPFDVIFHELLSKKEHLEEAMTKAELESRAKSEFLAHMSHEIRTPIGGIIGMADVLMPRLDDPESLKYLSLIRESADSLLGILSGILDLSRIELGKQELTVVEFRPREETAKLAASSEILAAKKGLSFSVSYDSTIPERLSGDSGLIGQVLRNLISNAIKYTDRGGITLRIENLNRTGKDIDIRFSVEDTGIGIPLEKRHLLFRSFKRLKGSLTRPEGEGAGLGLVISRNLVELMDGRMEVHSLNGGGSCFAFVIPLTVCEENEQACDEKPETLKLSDLPPLRFLLAEDNQINRMFLEKVISDSGHTVRTAVNGKEAVQAVNEDSFDIVLMDIQMPEMDGLEATAEIRASGFGKEILPVIALTAFAMKGDEEQFLQAGMNGYVTKPVEWDRLTTVIRENLP